MAKKPKTKEKRAPASANEERPRRVVSITLTPAEIRAGARLVKAWGVNRSRVMAALLSTVAARPDDPRWHAARRLAEDEDDR
jgi:hypothetical protein